MAQTIGRLSEEIKKILDGGDSPLASSVDQNEIKISIGQVVNSLLKTEYLSTNIPMGEYIPNNAVLGWYEDIDVESWNSKSRAKLPIKPISLPMNMGIYSVYPRYENNGGYELDKEFIPLQMGESSKIKSQLLINDLSGRVGYEPTGGGYIQFTKDIKKMWPEIKLAMRLVVMDVSQYGDWDVLPITSDMEWQVKQQVIALYSQEPIPDKIVDSAVKERKNTPINQQTQ